MIARLQGSLLEKQPNRVVVDVGGVGYEVHVPLSTFYGLGGLASEVTLRVHTHVREEALSLFGFSTALEKEIFEQLIGVSGIGPRLALAVLSGMEPPELVRAVRQQDVARLTGIPGVGKKTAERIGLELKDRLPPVLEEEPGTTEPPSESPPEMRDDLMSALLNLGYHRPLAERAVEAALNGEDGSFEQTLRRALRELAR
jgi:Holliday junction DNA helicase RuvA|tara:strand:+ start:458 stop:1057 length:600 start_codon:yes stop_codon:yes gene_type:complete